MPNTLEELLNENMHRNYPIMDGGSAQDLTGSYNIPTELIADISLVVPDGSVINGTFFISSLVVRRYTIDVEISYKPNSTQNAFILGWFHNIDADASVFQTYEFTTVPQSVPALAEFEDTTGTLTAGVGVATTTLPGVWDFDSSDTPLVPSTTNEQLTKFRSLQIGDETFTGNIILKEGDNVTLTPSYDSVTDTTTITISAREITSGDPINNDQDLMNALTNLYGQPIVRINEIEPQGSGDFYLVGSDCVEAVLENTGIKFENSCGKPCCSEEGYLTPVYDALNQLNARHVRLEDFLKGTVKNTDMLLSRLKNMENSVGLGGF